MNDDEHDETQQSAKIDHRKVWNAGYHAGLKAALHPAGKSQPAPRPQTIMEKAMNQARYQSIYNNLSVMDRKVFDIMPHQEVWTVDQLIAEFIRLHRTVPEYRVIKTSAEHLRNAGLVRSPAKEQYQTNPNAVPKTNNNVHPIKKPETENNDDDTGHDDDVVEMAHEFYCWVTDQRRGGKYDTFTAERYLQVAPARLRVAKIRDLIIPCLIDQTRLVEISPRTYQVIYPKRKDETTMPATIPPVTGTPLESMYTHITELRSMLDRLESDILAVDEYMKNKTEDMEKLQQLKQLLSSIK